MKNVKVKGQRSHRMTIEVTSLPPPVAPPLQPASALLCCAAVRVSFLPLFAALQFINSHALMSHCAPPSLPFFLALFLQFLTAQLVRQRERETEREREEGSEAVGHAGAAAAYRGCQARRADQRRLMDRQTVQHTHSPSFTPPLPLPPGTSNTFFSTHIFYRRF